MKIRMLTTVRPDIPFLAMPGIVLKAGEVYEAIGSRNEAICVIYGNRFTHSLAPDEFEIVEEG